MTHDQPGASTAQVRGDAGLRGLCARIDEGLPFLKYLGFSFWVAWFGVAYNSVCWLTPTETTSTAVNDMFVISTLAHVVTLLAFALLYRRASGIVRRRTFVLASALVACAGCACVLLAGPLYVHSRALFYVGSALTGMGTATLCVNGGLLLCAHRPAAALRTLLSCELAACLIEYMVVGLPYVLSCAMFVAMPLLSALCYVVGNARPEPAAVAESSRLEPPREMWRLLVATFVWRRASSRPARLPASWGPRAPSRRFSPSSASWECSSPARPHGVRQALRSCSTAWPASSCSPW